jgi:hypothetical protein
VKSNAQLETDACASAPYRGAPRSGDNESATPIDVRSLVTPATESERLRLELGIERAGRALDALRRLAADRRRDAGEAPRPIALAIVDFESQIVAARKRLDDLPGLDAEAQPPCTADPSRRSGAIDRFTRTASASRSPRGGERWRESDA